jgi:hypothetical protein
MKIILVAIALLPCAAVFAETSVRTEILDAYYEYFGEDAVLYCGGTLGGQVLFSRPTEESAGVGLISGPFRNIVKVMDRFRITLEGGTLEYIDWLFIQTAWGHTGWLLNYDNPSGHEGRGFEILRPVSELDDHWFDMAYEGGILDFLEEEDD